MMTLSTAGLALTLAFALLIVSPSGSAGAQDVLRAGDAIDPVIAAALIDDARIADPDYPGRSRVVVVGRSDVFADNLAATALAGAGGTILLNDSGPDADLRAEVAQQLEQTLAAAPCGQDGAPTIYIAGGVQAVSEQVEQSLRATDACVERVSGVTRVETAIAVADAVADPSDVVVLARADDWADAGAVGAWAALTRSRVLVTDTTTLLPVVEQALRRMAPEQIVLVGGIAALSAGVADAAADIAPVRRVAGAARDATAVAIATDLWGDDAGPDRTLADGYGPLDWTYLFAGAALAAQRRAPILYTDMDRPTATTQAHLDAVQPPSLLVLGPDDGVVTPPAPDLQAADVTLQTVATMDAPLMLQARPGAAELWVAERVGRLVALADGGRRTVLDISDTVSTNGERGLLGFAFHPDGTRVFTSSTDPGGTSVIDAFDIVGDQVDAVSRRELLRVPQPASNHNGGDLQWGPDGYLWWSLGDGGGANDQFENGQNPRSLLGSLVRIDVDGGDPYVIPADNPFADGDGGAPELWAYGLRNPFRFSFDRMTGDLWIGDVGQSAVEEIDLVPAGTGSGSNFGWPIFEGTQPFRGGSLPDHVPPVFQELHRDGNCSLTGGVVYRGSAIPELYGAYLYTDLCRTSIRAILVQDGQVTQTADLGVSVGSPVGFGTDHDGEVYVLGLSGDVAKIAPA